MAPTPSDLEGAALLAAKKRVLMSGLITAVGIALHNLPEGVAVFLASMKSPSGMNHQWGPTGTI
jgi:zinc transporter ZupT